MQAVVQTMLSTYVVSPVAGLTSLPTLMGDGFRPFTFQPLEYYKDKSCSCPAAFQTDTTRSVTTCNKVTIAIKYVLTSDSGLYIVGLDVSGTD